MKEPIFILLVIATVLIFKFQGRLTISTGHRESKTIIQDRREPLVKSRHISPPALTRAKPVSASTLTPSAIGKSSAGEDRIENDDLNWKNLEKIYIEESPLDSEDNDTQQQSQRAIDVWVNEREQFYREELRIEKMERKEIDAIESELAEKIRILQEAFNKTPPTIDAEAYTSEFMRLDAEYNSRMSRVLGAERAESAEMFRESFNDSLISRFGLSHLRITRI